MGDKYKNESNISKINRYDIEEALAKLLFYIKASLLCKEYEPYKNQFEGLLKIANKWLNYYVENNDLHQMTDEEAYQAYVLRDEIPFDAYMGGYYEEVETFLDVVIYYGNCPIGVQFNEHLIKRKGMEKYNGRQR